MIIKIIAGSTESNIEELYKYDKNEFVIGVDGGCITAIDNDIKLNLAIGDFDSVTLEELDRIKLHSKEVIKLNPNKDVSDTLAALNIAKTYNYEEIIIFGATGGRIDHFISNLHSLKDIPRAYIVDRNNKIYILEKGNYKIKKEMYRYISFYGFPNAYNLSLSNFKYELLDYDITYNDTLCLSNEIIDEGIISFHDGTLLVVESK